MIRQASFVGSVLLALLLASCRDLDADGTFDLVVASATTPNTQRIKIGSAGVKSIKVRVTDPVTGRQATATVDVTVS